MFKRREQWLGLRREEDEQLVRIKRAVDGEILLVAPLTRLLLHALSYTPTLTRPLLHAYSYTLTLTRLLLHALSYTPTLTRAVGAHYAFGRR